jgi:[acyl-carrier-protein] S-malonyltransferase
MLKDKGSFMMNKTAFLFPGQGSQFVEMGKDLYDESPAAKEIFKQVDDICQKPISNLCFEGPLEELTITENLQPAVTAVNLACLAILKESGCDAAVSAGHSLGEYAALVSAGVINNYDALRVVHKRGQLMHREALANPGDMVAVIGIDINGLREIINETKGDGILSIANHNTYEQIVITGDKEPVARAAQMVKDRTGRAISLKVSGAWHSELMKGAVDEFRQFMEDIHFSEPRSVVLFNATARKETNPEKIKDIMANQLVSPVKWYDIVRTMLKAGVETFVEVGPKNVLTGLLKKIVPDASKFNIYNVQDVKSLKQYIEC